MHRKVVRRWLIASLAALSVNCTRSPVSGVSDGAPAAASVTSVDGQAQPVHLTNCPIELRPGLGLGPIRVGQTRQELSALGVPIKTTKHFRNTEFASVGPFQVELCAGEVASVGIDDLRKTIDCVMFDGKRLDRVVATDDLIALLKECRPLVSGFGLATVDCGSGVFLGLGYNDYLRVTVAKKGSDSRDTCDHYLDDGKSVPLADTTRAQILQKVLNLDLLSKYWHPDAPERRPLPVVKTDAVKGAPRLMMFGYEVTYVDKNDAERRSLPFFEFTSIESTATRLRVRFRYPVEGVAQTVIFVLRGDWRVDENYVWKT